VPDLIGRPRVDTRRPALSGKDGYGLLVKRSRMGVAEDRKFMNWVSTRQGCKTISTALLCVRRLSKLVVPHVASAVPSRPPEVAPLDPCFAGPLFPGTLALYPDVLHQGRRSLWLEALAYPEMWPFFLLSECSYNQLRPAALGRCCTRLRHAHAGTSALGQLACRFDRHPAPGLAARGPMA